MLMLPLLRTSLPLTELSSYGGWADLQDRKRIRGCHEATRIQGFKSNTWCFLDTSKWWFHRSTSGQHTTLLYRTPLIVQDPGRVLPGKKMAGHMGVVKRTTQNLLVHRVDTALNAIFVRGAVPGVDDAFVSIRDSKKKVSYKAQTGLMKGKNEDEWLGGGVKTLPTPAGTRERVESEGWPQVIEWAGKGEKERP